MSDGQQQVDFGAFLRLMQELPPFLTPVGKTL
jgi:hypothetical protein